MVSHYSCCTYVNNQAKFIEIRLTLQTNHCLFSWCYLALIEMEMRVDKIHFSYTSLWISDSSLLPVSEFCFLPGNGTVPWIVVSSNICLDLSKLTFPVFSPSFDLESLGNSNCPFPKAKAGQLDMNFREVTRTAHVWTVSVPVAVRATWGSATECLRTTSKTDPQSRKVIQTEPTTLIPPPEGASNHHLEVCSTGWSPDTETESVICWNRSPLFSFCFHRNVSR